MPREAEASHWSRIQERGSLLGLRFTVGCYRVLGRTLSLPLVLGVATYFYLTDSAGRAASSAFLERVRGRLERQFSASEVDCPSGPRASFCHYIEFALSIADRISLWGDPPGSFEFDFHGREHFDRIHKEGKGALLLGAHLGSFDALRVVSTSAGVPVNVLMYTEHAPSINAVFREISPEVDVRVLPVSGDAATTALRIRACIERGEHVAILADRVEPDDRRRVRQMEFLGAPANFPDSPFLLAALLGCPTLMVVALRQSSRRYEVTAELLSDSPGSLGVSRANRATRADALASSYVEHLERLCLRAPRQWFNFYDFWAEASLS
jgi:predicted LPLAT superfamily acyltransferase